MVDDSHSTSKHKPGIVRILITTSPWQYLVISIASCSICLGPCSNQSARLREKYDTELTSNGKTYPVRRKANSTNPKPREERSFAWIVLLDWFDTLRYRDTLCIGNSQIGRVLDVMVYITVALALETTRELIAIHNIPCKWDKQKMPDVVTLQHIYTRYYRDKLFPFNCLNIDQQGDNTPAVIQYICHQV